MDRTECLFCRKTYSHNPFSPFCPDCGEPLLISSEEPGRKRSVRPGMSFPLETYAEFLPLDRFDRKLSLSEGNTPLVALNTLGSGSLGMRHVFAKNEAQNPTGSFKDRGTALAIQKAVTLGFTRIGTVSTGNMAASTAAHGARAGVETFVLLKEGTSPLSLRAAGVYGSHLVSVRGDYGRLFHESIQVGKNLGIYFMNSVDPFRIEGYKVTGFEIFSQLGRRPPRILIVPLSSGGHLLGLMRAFEDLERAGLVSSTPTFVGVQAEGCAPLVAAFESGRAKYERLNDARTIAHAISNPAPPAGNAVLKLIREHGGILLAVSDDDMLAAQRMLAASEGLFCQPESAATLAALFKLRKDGRVGKDDETVLVLTGSGFKTPPALESCPLEYREFPLEGLEEGLRALA